MYSTVNVCLESYYESKRIPTRTRRLTFNDVISTSSAHDFFFMGRFGVKQQP